MLITLSAAALETGQEAKTAAKKNSRNQVYGSFSTFERVYEPSGIHQLPDGRFIIVEDDKRQPITLVAITSEGRFSETRLNPKEIFKKGGEGSRMRKLDDLEAVAVDRYGQVYAITSHSRNSKGKSKKSREKLTRFEIFESTIVKPVIVESLSDALSDTHPLLKQAAEIDNVKAAGGLNIEGLCFDPAEEQLLIGFRSPLANGKAIIAAIENVDETFKKDGIPKISDELIRLDLNGEGIRGMTYDCLLYTSDAATKRIV